MPHHLLPPNPSLVAILLVIKTSSGPRLVFHYPPNPACSSSALPANPQWYSNGTSTGTDDEDTSSTSSTEWNTDSDEEEEDGGSRAGSIASTRGTSRLRDGSRSRRGAKSLKSQTDVDEDADDDVDGLGEEDGMVIVRTSSGHGAMGGKKGGGPQDSDGKPDWDKLLGFKSEGLEKLLCPGKKFRKRKFEVGLEGLCFLGCPMFAKEGAGWKKKRRRRKGANDAQEDASQKPTPEAEESDENAPADAEDEGIEIMTPDKTSPRLELPSGYEAGYGHVLSSNVSDAGSDTKSASTTSGPSEMTMFNIVFVLNPPALEYQLRSQEMYDNAIKKFAKDLKHEQRASNYVWRESKTILAIKNKAKDGREGTTSLWHSILSTSSLARSIAILFDSLSNSKIAHIHLETLADASYQIPQAPSTPYLSRATDPQMPGLWLTTANLPDDGDEGVFNVTLTPHHALLLLEDKETLLREIEGDAKEHSAQLAFYISNLTPTKSLQKLATLHKIPVADLEFIAAHLIYWRRARAIPPLHQRDTYIVSPNADMRKLPQAIPAYATRFPTLPSLPKMLSMLSTQQPRTYGSFIPSKDHRHAYMEILAWLMRGGWVTQLRTFAWIRVSPEVQAEVAAIMEREAKDATRAAIQHARDRRAAMGDHSDDASDRATIASDDAPSTPHRKSPRDSESSGHAALSETSSIRSPRAAFHTSPRDSQHKASPLHASYSASATSDFHGTPATPRRPHLSHSFHAASKDPADYQPRMIYSPQKANALEARWIEHIKNGFEDSDVQSMFPVLQKYFDGRHALDDIAGREGIKRKRVWGVLGVMRERNVLFVMRHW
ncbi:uncharacterized protein K452DRAFT_349068 [Aplosporella prunicola CBS 121167]|uniref:Nitrogen permease regulator 3 n=1 Tax=Aplosporella prunicola CBS 121167 TaxID=1176127 RepID=A0A6A6BN74_9PEZI|nr:uncharacterized protein K452DRAFT_349068 [Aplosporella prunicola CBS 121167]KAF2145552.1 hypothetical protein K452DRAFT_349068 [Aplosporella prunicola CBS 121167]